MQPSTSSNFLALLNSTGSVNLPVFVSDSRDIQPARLLPALLSGLVATRWMVLLVCIAISMRCSSMILTKIAYKPFHNQLRKQGFPLFMRTG